MYLNLLTPLPRSAGVSFYRNHVTGVDLLRSSFGCSDWLIACNIAKKKKEVICHKKKLTFTLSFYYLFILPHLVRNLRYELGMITF